VAAIKKLLLWRTQSPIMPRWDLEISFEDGTKTRRTAVTLEKAVEVVRKALGQRVSARKGLKRRRRPPAKRVKPRARGS
jgi:hypothetical protein